MEISSKHQLYVFVVSFLSGVGCGLLFDIQRSLRRVRFAGGIRTTLEDILFASISTFGIIALGFFLNKGQMRYYQVWGTVSGALFYSAFLTKSVMTALGKFYRFMYTFFIKPIVKIAETILLPIRCIYGVTTRKIRRIRVFLKKTAVRIKKSKNRLKKRMKML